MDNIGDDCIVLTHSNWKHLSRHRFHVMISMFARILCVVAAALAVGNLIPVAFGVGFDSLQIWKSLVASSFFVAFAFVIWMLFQLVKKQLVLSTRGALIRYQNGDKQIGGREECSLVLDRSDDYLEVTVKNSISSVVERVVVNLADVPHDLEGSLLQLGYNFEGESSSAIGGELETPVSLHRRIF